MALAQPIDAHVTARIEARLPHEQQREQPREATRPLAEGLDAHHVHREGGDHHELAAGRRKATPLTPNSRSFACKGLYERQVFGYVSYDCGAGVH